MRSSACLYSLVVLWTSRQNVLISHCDKERRLIAETAKLMTQRRFDPDSFDADYKEIIERLALKDREGVYLSLFQLDFYKDCACFVLKLCERNSQIVTTLLSDFVLNFIKVVKVLQDVSDTVFISFYKWLGILYSQPVVVCFLYFCPQARLPITAVT